MKLKNMWKRFWTLDVHNHEGFTLVELIIVIAILAILSTGAIAGYSAYVESANKTADKAMIAEIENVLLMAYYNGDLQGEASIVLGADGVVKTTGNLDQILTDAYGSNWSTALKLKYSDWKGMTSDKIFAEAYKNSSFNGNEDALINQVGSLTNVLKDALAVNKGLIGDNFDKFLQDNDIPGTNQAISNAAVLYAADTIEGKEDAINAAFEAYYADPRGDAIQKLTRTLQDDLGTFGAVAALYAHGEAFGQYVAADNPDSDILDNFHDIGDVTDANAAITKIAKNLENLINEAATEYSGYARDYMDGQWANDVTAYMETLKKIDANADKFTDNLDSSDCYTDGTAAALLQAAIAAGSMNVECQDGQVAIWIADGVIGDTVSDIQK